jgi:programmed cell death 6-interacting protein
MMNFFLLLKAWLSILAGKQAMFHALSEYHRAEHENSEKNIGEQLARLGKSLELFKIAEQRGGKEFAVNKIAVNVQNAFEKAKKENEYVYNERVPDYKTLKPIDRAALAKATPIKLPISDDFRGTHAILVFLFFVFFF